MTDYKHEVRRPTDYNNGQIHGWNGGDCPVHPETEVEYWRLYGGTDELMAGCLRWEHRSVDDDIIAFRVIKQHVEPKVIWVNEYSTGNVTFTSEEAAKKHAMNWATRIAVKYVEVDDE